MHNAQNQNFFQPINIIEQLCSHGESNVGILIVNMGLPRSRIAKLFEGIPFQI
jgi:hypothetical protein